MAGTGLLAGAMNAVAEDRRRANRVGAALLLAGPAVVGSYGGARLARRADVAILRVGIIALGVAITAAPFLRASG